jgi:hypothetical protein
MALEALYNYGNISQFRDIPCVHLKISIKILRLFHFVLTSLHNRNKRIQECTDFPKNLTATLKFEAPEGQHKQVL